jgi:hypothetical protein
MFGRKPKPTAKPSAAVLFARFTERLDSLLADYADDVGARRLAEQLESRAQALRLQHAINAPVL